MPVLLPGILELTRRARYFSFYAFLLAEYRARRFPADRAALSRFIKLREWELGLAVLRCPNGCDSSPVGARRLGSVARGGGPFRRGESVESPLGGYGLYYRSPMIDMGLVARSGTLLGETLIPIDVLCETGRANRLAQTFKSAVEHTSYYQSGMLLTTDLTADVIDEYATVACLCRLPELPEELAAVHDALFGVGPVDGAEPPADASAAAAPSTGTGAGGDGGGVTAGFVADAGVVQRRRSVGHYLTLIAQRPEVVSSESVYRDAMWMPESSRGAEHDLVAGQWSALIAKDVWQEAICSVWSEFCRAGLARTETEGRGLAWDEAREAAARLVAGPPSLDAVQPTRQLTGGGVPAGPDLGGLSMEGLRRYTVEADTAASGLVVLLELDRRAQSRSGAGWEQACRLESAWQPSLASVLAALRTHLDTGPSAGETLWWLVSRFVVPVHERIAYSKLPEFTFRFRWEEGLLRFHNLGIGRFPLAAIRHEALASLTRDLGLWEPVNGEGVLTDRGHTFTREVFA